MASLRLAVLVLAVSALAVAFFFMLRGDRPRPDYSVERDPRPTIQADTVGVGHIVGYTPSGEPNVYPVKVRGVESVGEYVILEHFNPRGCDIGVHGSECVIRTALRREDRIPLFPAESG